MFQFAPSYEYLVMPGVALVMVAELSATYSVS